MKLRIKAVIAVFGTIKAIVNIHLILTVLMMFHIFVIDKIPEKRAEFNCPDNDLKLVVYEIGSPEFYSANECKAVLYNGHSSVDEIEFEVYNDGGNVGESSFSIEWEDSRAIITAKGIEQGNKHYSLYY